MTESITPDEAVTLYLKDREPDVTESTFRNHRYHLKRFREWCDDVGFDDMSEMTGKRIYEYKIYRREVGDVNQVTLSNQLSTFRVFLRFCENLDFVEKGTAESVMMPDIKPGEDARDIALDSDTANQILDYLQKFEYGTFRHALFYLLWHTGMRTGSVRSLDLDDYHPDEYYLEVRHRPDTGTRLKNKHAGEREVNLKPEVCEVLDDYIQIHRHEVTDDYGRRPLLTTKSGRAYNSLIQKNIYTITRPCHYTGNCPHGRDIEDCEANSFDYASKCPSSVSPHPIRRSAITAHLNADVPKEITADRVNVSVNVLEKHYDARSESEKRELRRGYLGNI
ncbi:tyrosine-type recombinase/integrase [Haloferax volcanii]|uniref:tyrosine-type recombinase/integrase n=1 Tax=Haloferax volcanii TaxID=2246 RepID=UPI0023DB2BE0|nr:site-specific integrase [Haloferax lucentense]WEL26503.1 XerD/XerC family integrase [Haloferax lucentense]